MSREEMLDRLQSISFCAVPTVMTEDMGLEFQFVTPEGAGTVLGTIGDWPVHAFRPIKPEQWKFIISKIKSEKLTIEDLSETDLEVFANEIKELHEDQFTSLSDTFACLADVDGILENKFFCLYDLRAWDDTPVFYLNIDDLKNAFYETYCIDSTAWEDMDDDDLEYWIERLDESFENFPVKSYDDTQDDN